MTTDDPTNEIEAVRQSLLEFCNQKAKATFGNRTTSPRQVRAGMYEAQRIIETEPAHGTMTEWLEAVIARFEAERMALSRDPDDEDGWSLGGLRTIQNRVEAALEESRRAPARPHPLRFSDWLRKKISGDP